MAASSGRDELLGTFVAHLRGEVPSSLLTALRRAKPLAVRTALPELLTAILLAGTQLDDDILAIVVDAAERYPSLDEQSQRAVADEYAVAHLLDALGAGAVVEASGDMGSTSSTAHWEERGRMLADQAALAIPGCRAPDGCTRQDLVRAAVLETSAFHPKTAMRMLRWLPFVEEPPVNTALERELVGYLCHAWPGEAEIEFDRAVLASIGA